VVADRTACSTIGYHRIGMIVDVGITAVDLTDRVIYRSSQTTRLMKMTTSIVSTVLADFDPPDLSEPSDGWNLFLVICPGVESNAYMLSTLLNQTVYHCTYLWNRSTGCHCRKVNRCLPYTVYMCNRGSRPVFLNTDIHKLRMQQHDNSGVVLMKLPLS